jgi:death-on-curing protein
MRYLSLGEVVYLHQAIFDQSGGATGVRDLGMLESALAQPRATFGGTDLRPTLVGKAAALGFSLAMNHPSVDGNKRIAHAAMEVFLLLNGAEINAALNEQERLMLDLAAGNLTRGELTVWLELHVRPTVH